VICSGAVSDRIAAQRAARSRSGPTWRAEHSLRPSREAFATRAPAAAAIASESRPRRRSAGGSPMPLAAEGMQRVGDLDDHRVNCVGTSSDSESCNA